MGDDSSAQEELCNYMWVSSRDSHATNDLSGLFGRISAV